MSGWSDHKGEALVLDIDNIDTDQLIPARFMSVPRSEGYGKYLMHDLRRDESGTLREDFALNQCNSATILVAGRNFGTGSSREAAVYALVDAGFRVVIAPSFGDIFASNAVNNGLLPARLSDVDVASLSELIRLGETHIDLSLDLLIVRCGSAQFSFELPDAWLMKLQNGWDDIDLTLQLSSEVASFRQARKNLTAWAFP